MIKITLDDQTFSIGCEKIGQLGNSTSTDKGNLNPISNESSDKNISVECLRPELEKEKPNDYVNKLRKRKPSDVEFETFKKKRIFRRKGG
jgi:hypothetical protein